MKILYQGSPGAYSHLAALEIYPDAEVIAALQILESHHSDEMRTVVQETLNIIEGANA